MQIGRWSGPEWWMHHVAVDLLTGKIVAGVIEADDETGEVYFYRRNKCGGVYLTGDGEIAFSKKIMDIKIIPLRKALIKEQAEADKRRSKWLVPLRRCTAR